MEPTLRIYDGCRLLRHIHVSQHHIVTVDTYFAYAFFIDIYNLKIRTRESHPYRCRIRCSIRIQCAHRSTFCKAVALQRQYAEIPDSVQNLRIYGCTSAYQASHPSSEYSGYLIEEYLAQIYSDLLCLSVDPYYLLQQIFLTLLFNCFPDGAVELFKYSRNSQEHGRLYLLQILGDVLETLTVCDGCSLVERHQEIACTFISMMKRQH